MCRTRRILALPLTLSVVNSFPTLPRSNPPPPQPSPAPGASTVIGSCRAQFQTCPTVQYSTVLKSAKRTSFELRLLHGFVRHCVVVCAEGEADTNHIRYGLINRKGAKMMIYFQRVMLPAITKPVMLHVVDQGPETGDRAGLSASRPGPVADRVREYGCCKGVQGPSSGVEVSSVCTPVRCPRVSK